jgi:hypothetical protein
VKKRTILSLFSKFGCSLKFLAVPYVSCPNDTGLITVALGEASVSPMSREFQPGALVPRDTVGARPNEPLLQIEHFFQGKFCYYLSLPIIKRGTIMGGNRLKTGGTCSFHFIFPTIFFSNKILILSNLNPQNSSTREYAIILKDEI